MQRVCLAVLVVGLAACSDEQARGPVALDADAIPRWVDTELRPSTLSRDEQIAELGWYREAAKPFAGMEISVVSETLTTHEYEARVLRAAFEDVTGIRVRHELIQEGDVIEKLQTQMQ